MARDKVSTDILWKDRKRILFLGLPWSFTRYSVSKDRFFVSKGFFSIKDDEVRLYRIMDISLERSFLQRLVGVGTIKVCSGDKTMGDFEIKNIKRPKATKELLSELVEKQRDVKRVVNRENMIDGHEHSDGHDDFDAYERDDDDSPFDR